METTKRYHLLGVDGGNTLWPTRILSFDNRREPPYRAAPMSTDLRGRIVHHVVQDPISLVDCLVKHFKLSDESARQLISFGAIYSNKLRVFENVTLEKGRYLRIHLRPKRFKTADIDWKKILIHSASDYIVVNKPPGVPVHATLDNVIENVVAQMRKVLNCELYATQRLDIPVGGLLVIAKTKKFQSDFNRMLLERKVKKIYLALTEREVPTGRHLHYMEPSERSPKRVLATPQPGWQDCLLTVESSLPVNENTFINRIQLETGRTHQIRAQLGCLGAPIIGDFLYAGKRNPTFHLFCTELSWKGTPPFQAKPDWIPASIKN